MAEQGDIEHTLVMSDTSGTETGSKSGSQRSDIVIKGSHKTIETVDLNADSSLEFRRTLEKSGKRYQIKKMIAEGGFGRIFLAKDLVRTADAPAKLTLTPDRTEIASDFHDLCYFRVTPLDRNGVVCETAENLVKFSVEGPGEIVNELKRFGV